MKKTRRSEQFAIRLTPAEMAAIKRGARAAHLASASFVRQTLFAALAKPAGRPEKATPP